MLTQLTLPENLDFADLALERKPVTHRLLLLPAPFGALRLFNGLDPETVFASEDLSCELICEWYVAHRQSGCAPDPVADEIRRVYAPWVIFTLAFGNSRRIILQGVRMFARRPV